MVSSYVQYLKPGGFKTMIPTGQDHRSGDFQQTPGHIHISSHSPHNKTDLESLRTSLFALVTLLGDNSGSEKFFCTLTIESNTAIVVKLFFFYTSDCLAAVNRIENKRHQATQCNTKKHFTGSKPVLSFSSNTASELPLN